ncbi:hypothetical protein [Mangrovicella endophytica]|uniref:hypothetical protein n=1 Tax=Mangrovicella endophytica TaxID=2066697 RepID=UPI000C9E232B|nr:hypothetical protein [Mangrovicella endophytica]
MGTTFLHIGTHKTGTTSIQRTLDAQRALLASHGIAYFAGRHIRTNHVELHAAAMRDERMSPFKLVSGVRPDDDYRRSVLDSISAFLKTPADKHIFSAEGLSFLRYRDEVEWIRRAIPGEVEIIVYLREKEAYRASHIAQMDKRNGLIPHWDPDAVVYMGPDSYLLDYDRRLDPWRTVFGAEKVKVIDYDEEVARHGTVFPSFLTAIGAPDALPRDVWENVFLNRRSPGNI